MTNRKLIEVALPLEKINEESSKEKSIRFGHPSTLHLWWARRPLATTRAIIFASIVDDPSAHPELFPTEELQIEERKRLFKIIEQLCVWDNLNNSSLVEAARREIKKYTDGELPKFYDPFGGGGSIPIEAQRLGLETYASDLNPVAVMINKAMIEIPQKCLNHKPIYNEGQERLNNTWNGLEGLAYDVEKYGEWIGKEAEKRIGKYFPKISIPEEDGGGEATVIAWMWTRTVTCPNPACKCKMPLIKSFDLVKDKKDGYYVEPIIDNSHIRYEIRKGSTKRKPTVGRKGAQCIACDSPVDFEYIRSLGKKNEIGYELLGIVAVNEAGKRIVLPAELDNSPIEIPRPTDYFDTEIAYYPGCTNCKNYGMTYFSDLCTNRQLLSLVTFSDLAIEVKKKMEEDTIANGECVDVTYINAVQVYLAFAVDRLASRSTQVCVWHTSRKTIEHPFGRQAIPMVWTFPESNPFSGATGGWDSALSWIPKVIRNYATDIESGVVTQEDAMSGSKKDKYLVSTDPPYYSNVPYADLSDFFYVWLRKILREQYPELFMTLGTPKSNELVAERYRYDGDEQKAKEFFEDGMYKAFCKIFSYVDDRYPFTIYYAFKQTDGNEDDVASSGWETMLSGLIRAGFKIVGTWPVRTEMTTGLKTNLNFLGSSIVLVCRKREDNASVCTRRNFVNELKRNIKPALKNLQSSNIAPVDLAQSAIGPGMAVFSKYNKVLEADGSEMTVRSALQIINQELDLYFNEQDGELDKDSRFCVDLYSQYAFNTIKFGEADILARAKNTSVAFLASSGLLYGQKGEVRLLERAELNDKVDSNSATWLLCQQLTKAMEVGGIEACAKIIAPMYGSAPERAKDLAYRLFTIAERKGWTQEAYAYNALVVSWTEIQSRAAALQAIEPKQMSIFDLE